MRYIKGVTAALILLSAATVFTHEARAHKTSGNAAILIGGDPVPTCPYRTCPTQPSLPAPTK